MGDLEGLLELQAHDISVAQLGHQKLNLSERAAAEELRRTLGALRVELAAANKSLEGAEALQQRLESSIAEADNRIAVIEARMFGGTVSAGRELESMAAEVVALKSRRSGIEDEALEAMEATDTARQEHSALADRDVRLAADAGTLAEELVRAETLLDEHLAVESAERTRLLSSLPPELVDQYERIRVKLGGIGAARLEGDHCTGCHLSLPSGEIERLRHLPPDTVAYCDNCGRILVR